MYLVTGGYNQQENIVLDSTELFKDGVWTLFPKSLPMNLRDVAVAKIENRVFLFGMISFL